MANRIVPVSVSGPWIQFGGDASGAVGSANALTLRVHFDSQWEGTGKTAYFWDALRLEATQVVVALGSLVPGETDTYDVPVPGECMTQGGYAWVTFRGTSEDRVITTKAEKIPVHLAYIPNSAGNSQPITPSELDQILQQLDGLEDTLEEDRQAAESAAEQAAASAQEAAEGAEQAGNSAQSAGENAGAAERWSRTAESWAVGGTGTRTGEDTDNAQYYASQAKKEIQRFAVSVDQAEDAAQFAQESATSAEQSAQSALQSAASAGASAQGAAQSEQAAASSASAADKDAEIASEGALYASRSAQTAQAAASSAASSAQYAAQKAQAAQESAGSAQSSAAQAESWAVGGTGTRLGEDADNAQYYANLAQAEADRATVPAVSGLYNMILSDRVTGDQYALIVEYGVLKLLGVSSGLTATELELADLATGAGYSLVVESGVLKLQEV